MTATQELLLGSLLEEIPIFVGLKPSQLQEIAALGQLERHERGARLFSEGDPGDKLYLILEGAVRISRAVSGLGEEAFAVLKQGETFGEMSIIDDAPRSADAHIHEPSRLFVLQKNEFAALLNRDSGLAYALLKNYVRILVGRLRNTNDKMTFLAFAGKF